MAIEKIDAARILYLDGTPQNEIAKLLGVQDKTVSKWQTSGNWKDQRIRLQLSDQTRQDTVLELIDYQLAVLKFKKNADLQLDEEDRQLLKAGDIDAVQKLFTTVKRQEMKWGDVVKIMREYLDFTRTHNPELAKASIDSIDSYINEKRKLA